MLPGSFEISADHTILKRSFSTSNPKMENKLVIIVLISCRSAGECRVTFMRTDYLIFHLFPFILDILFLWLIYFCCLQVSSALTYSYIIFVSLELLCWCCSHFAEQTRSDLRNVIASTLQQRCNSAPAATCIWVEKKNLNVKFTKHKS